jgi:hypothetical protein
VAGPKGEVHGSEYALEVSPDAAVRVGFEWGADQLPVEGRQALRIGRAVDESCHGLGELFHSESMALAVCSVLDESDNPRCALERRCSLTGWVGAHARARAVARPPRLTHLSAGRYATLE